MAGEGAGVPEFGVRGAALTVVDDLLGVEWSVPRLDLGFRDGAGGRVAEGAAFLRFGEAETDIGFTLSLSGEAGGPSFSARLDGLPPRDIAEAHPALAPLRHVTTPLSGSIEVHFGRDYAIVSLEADLQGAGGAIVDARDAERSVAVDGLVIRARAVDGLTRLEIETVEIKALGHTARLSGGGARQDGAVSAFTHLENVTPALLAPLLPAALPSCVRFGCAGFGHCRVDARFGLAAGRSGPGIDHRCGQPARCRPGGGSRGPEGRQRPRSGRPAGRTDIVRIPGRGIEPRPRRGQR